MIREYLALNGRVFVLWDDGYLHVFGSMEEYEDPDCPPEEVIAPLP